MLNSNVGWTQCWETKCIEVGSRQAREVDRKGDKWNRRR